ncbi:MAG: hypothetical protein MI976_27005, partial [Pseudomonadales bacterium]|nr:hypothetical protein [Pseudomonadales bacterium]
MNLLNSLLSVNLFSRTLLVFFLCTSAAWAGNSVPGSYALSPWVYKKLEGARVSIDEEDYLIAETQLRSLVENNKLSSYEKAQSWNLLAYNYYLSKQPLASIKAYQRVLQEPQLSPGLQQSTLKTLAQLQYGEEQYRQALNNLSLLEQRTSLDNNLNLLKAYCLYQLDSFRAAAQVLDGLIANSQLPQENWLTLLQASYQQLGDFKRMTDTLE